jgi:Arc/MetJ family transcription regulator
MRIDIDIDDALIGDALRASGLATTRETIEAALATDDPIASAKRRQRRARQIPVARQSCGKPS